MPTGFALVAAEQRSAKADVAASLPRNLKPVAIHLGDCGGFSLVVRFLLWGFRHSGR
ncbi:MAG: hypothetical protein QOH04_1080 [Sphingomonadales bacterium]|nr:hypothetical protein [Sphingomonadales bacterium]MEA3035318.1 hypothetical protein [Sphingomonadales bacterium]